MKDGYQQLGKYIRPVDERNRDLEISKLLGVSITKQFIPSIANIVGTDLSNYKIVRTGQFAYGPVTSRNGEKISVALLEEDDCIISSSYSVFEVIDKNELNPEYLMLWFSRPEFDRYARYRSHGSVREIFDWDEMCQVELPVPDIDKQNKIVDAYRVITDRIALKQKINDNLLFCAQTYFKKTYVDFEGVPSNELIKTPDGLIPNGWTFDCVGNYCRDNIANLSKSDKYTTIKYLDTGGIFEGFVESTQQLNLSTDEIPSRAKRKVFDGDIVYSTVRPNLHHFGLIKNPNENFIASTGFAVLHNNGGAVSNELIYMWLTKESVLDYLQAIAENSVSTYPSLNVSDLLNVKIIIPTSEVLDESNRILATLFDGINANNLQIALLNQMKQTLLPILFSDR